MADEYLSVRVEDASLAERVADVASAAGIAVVPEDELVEGGVVVLGEGLPAPKHSHLVVMSSPTRRQTAEVLNAGAAGIVDAVSLERTLIPTVRAIAAGQIVVPKSGRNAVRRPMLSTREKQILGMVVLGCTNQEIATRLHLAPSTVKSHLGTMFAELGVRSRKEAADLVLDPSAQLGTGFLTIVPGEDERIG